MSDLARLAALQIQKETKVKNIFVGNLSFGATEASIRSMFESYGAVDRVNIVTDRDSGQPRGFAFVEMRSDDEGNRAIGDLNGRELDGRSLNTLTALFGVLWKPLADARGSELSRDRKGAVSRKSTPSRGQRPSPVHRHTERAAREGRPEFD
ncbi:MAG: hypothetical protein ABSH47_24165 [Bryobacteraceae bacterium]